MIELIELKIKQLRPRIKVTTAHNRGNHLNNDTIVVADRNYVYIAAKYYSDVMYSPLTYGYHLYKIPKGFADLELRFTGYDGGGCWSISNEIYIDGIKTRPSKKIKTVSCLSPFAGNEPGYPNKSFKPDIEPCPNSLKAYLNEVA